MKKQYLEAGKIVNTHGVKGEVRILPWADSAEFLAAFHRFYIDEKPVRVLSSRPHNDMLIAVLEGCGDVNAAMQLRDKVVFIDRNDARLSDGAFFIQDILGASVRDESGAELGVLEDVLQLPASDVYVVRGDREILIPDVPEFIRNTDVDAGIITVRLIEGM